VKVFRTLLRRELGVCFGVLNGYVIVSAALFLVGVCFYDLVYRLNTQPTDMTLTEMFFFSWYFWLILLLSTPLITMRTFAHEKSTGTYETLMTAPVSDVEVLLSKFCGALFFHAIIWLPVFISKSRLPKEASIQLLLRNTELPTATMRVVPLRESTP
jgi:ABC-2 type transport system permease protein